MPMLIGASSFENLTKFELDSDSCLLYQVQLTLAFEQRVAARSNIGNRGSLLL